MSTLKPTAITGPTVRARVRRVLRPLFVFVLVLRCVAALPPHRAVSSSHIETRGPLSRIVGPAPVQSAEQ